MTVTKSKKAVSSESEDLKAVLDIYGAVFQDLSSESKMGSEMLDHNISTEFAAFMEEVLKNPLQHSFDAFKLVAITIQDLLSQTTEAFLSEHKTLIKKVVCPGTRGLVYNIVLKNDTASNRVKLLEFIHKYENTVISQNFRIVFNFVPAAFEKHLTGKSLKL